MTGAPEPGAPQAVSARAPSPQLRTRRGTVAEFDVELGLGVVLDEEGAEHPFHCTAIADGTRDIAAGTPVTFRPVPARAGRIEATDLVPV